MPFSPAYTHGLAPTMAERAVHGDTSPRHGKPGGAATYYGDVPFALDFKNGGYRNAAGYKTRLSALSGYTYSRTGTKSRAYGGATYEAGENTPLIIPGQGMFLEPAAGAIGADNLAFTNQSIAGDFTVLFAAVMSAVDATQRIGTLTNVGATHYLTIQRSVGGGMIFGLGDVDGGTTIGAGVAGKGGVRTIKGAIIRTGNSYEVLIDGVSGGTTARTSAPTFTNIYPGANASAGALLNGILEKFFIDDRAYSPAEVAAFHA